MNLIVAIDMGKTIIVIGYILTTVQSVGAYSVQTVKTDKGQGGAA